MMRRQITILIIIFILLLLIIDFPLILSQEESVYTENPPEIDGIVSKGEWEAARKFEIRPKVWKMGTPPTGYLMLQNDEKFLYILLDLIQDTELNLQRAGGFEFPDLFYIMFDVDFDAKPSDGLDLVYLPEVTENGELKITGKCMRMPWPVKEKTETISSYAVGFNPSPNSEEKHVIWEIAINLQELISPSDQGTPSRVNLGIIIFSPIPLIQLGYPADIYTSSGVDFSKFIIINIQPPPPIFQVSNLNINPITVTVGEEVTITVLVVNKGGTSGTYTVTLKVDGGVVERKSVTLNAGESETVTFKYTPQQEGTISINVNGLTGSITVNPPPSGFPTTMIIAAIGGIAGVAVALILKMRKPKEKIPEPTAIRLTADPSEILGDGKSTSKIKVELIDDEGKLVQAPRDIEVKLRTTLGKITSSIVIPKGSTTGLAKLTSTTESGNAKITAEAKGLRDVSIDVTFIEKKRYCMHCGARMPLDAEVCPKCGRMPPSGVDVKVCKNCGAIIPVAAKFCSDCGASQAE